MEFKSRFSVKNSFHSLKTYCEGEGYEGWDPYDGLNSKVFNATPLQKWDFARLAWIQIFKRNPINLRTILAVPKQINAKGIGLFLSGYCSLFRISETGNEAYGTKAELLEKIHLLANLLEEIQSKGYSGACWGYNFDWQARGGLFFPAYTPTVVATTFCASALSEAYEITGVKKYRDMVLSSADFVLKDLSRTPYNSGFLFSYSPLNGNNTVFNASLLGAKLLSIAFRYREKEEYKSTARLAVLAACEDQNKDGSWVYGLLPFQSWKDSFHTGYNLDAIQTYQRNTHDFSFQSNINNGFEFYINNFFEVYGTPKYYHNKKFPIDIHCPGQLFVTLAALDRFEKHKEIAERVMKWTLNNMQDRKGYFYYQLKKGANSKIPYMRWSNAFMFNALGKYISKTISDNLDTDTY